MNAPNWNTINDAAMACTRGKYQVSLMRGESAWSGAGIIGTASKWGAVYARSRRALLARLQSVAAFRTVLVLTPGRVDPRMTRRLVLDVGGVLYDWLTERALSKDARGRWSLVSQEVSRAA